MFRPRTEGGVDLGTSWWMGLVYGGLGVLICLAGDVFDIEDTTVDIASQT